MSIRLMSQVFELDIPTGQKFVLIALADRAGDDGKSCFPSQSEISRKTSLAVKSVQRHLVWLEENGFIVRKRRHRSDGSRSTDEYTLNLTPQKSKATNCLGDKMSRRQNVQTKATNCRGYNETPVEPSVKINPSGLQKAPPDSSDDLKETEQKKPPKRKTAQRLPEDWDCSMELGEWAMEQGLTREGVVQAIDQFTDHWRAASGQKARKHDWDAAFRTWIRNEVKWERK